MRIRNAARILLLNENNEVFLFKIEDSYNQRIFWISPGGGLEEGESFEAAAHRELWEETGIRDAVLGPWVWAREKQVSFKGEEIISYERFFIVRVQHQEVVLDHMMEDERGEYRAYKWWSLQELQETHVLIFPQGFGEMIAPLLAGNYPASPVQILL